MAWLAATGHDSTLLTATRLYRLGMLRSPENVAGRGLIATTPQHVDLMAAWLAAFHDEAQTEARVLDWHALAQRRVAVPDRCISGRTLTPSSRWQE